MSELKVHKIGDLCFDFKMGKDVGIDFYLKSEADEVIAEKDKVIAELKKACNSKDEWCLHTLKENRHHKYKRCLDNACIEWLKQMNLCNYPGSIVFRNAVRRERKWRELAKKCKEAK